MIGRLKAAYRPAKVRLPISKMWATSGKSVSPRFCFWSDSFTGFRTAQRGPRGDPSVCPDSHDHAQEQRGAIGGVFLISLLARFSDVKHVAYESRELCGYRPIVFVQA